MRLIFYPSTMDASKTHRVLRLSETEYP